jgi:hypothetical protein
MGAEDASSNKTTVLWVFLVIAGIAVVAIVLGCIFGRKKGKRSRWVYDAEFGGARAKHAAVNALKGKHAHFGKQNISRPIIPAGGIVPPPNPHNLPPGPRRAPHKMPTPPRPAVVPGRPTRAAPRSAIRVDTKAYNHNKPMGPISPMRLGDWRRAASRHSAVSPR